MKTTIIEAWVMWLSGQSVCDKMLWGLQILWWGRLGKAVSFFSAVTIIAELLGPDRLKTFGDSLQQMFNLSQAWKALSYAFSWFISRLKLWYHHDNGGKFIEASKEYEKLKSEHPSAVRFFNLINLIIASLIIIALFIRDYDSNLHWALRLFLLAFIFIASILFINPIIVFFLLVIIQSLFSFVGFIIIKPFAQLLRNQNISTIVKIISLGLLIVGFFFDLLTS